jgi:hypothetical protein
VRWNAAPVWYAVGEFIFPADLSCNPLEGIYMTYSIGAAPAVCAYNNQVICNQRIPMKAGLVPIFLYVVAPSDLTCFPIECVECSCARADEENVSRNRGSRPYSAAGIVLPKYSALTLIECLPRFFLFAALRESRSRNNGETNHNTTDSDSCALRK